jgi:hypothetical protein
MQKKVLPAALLEIVYEYVYGGFTDFISIYQRCAEHPEVFPLIHIRRMQKIANNCARFYPEGNKWLYANRRVLRINWLEVAYYSLLGDNPFFLAKEKIEVLRNYKVSAELVLEQKYFEGRDNMFLSVDEIYVIGAAESDNPRLLKSVLPLFPFAFSPSDNIFTVHLIAKYDIFTKVMFDEREFSGLLTIACLFGNAIAVEKLLQRIGPQYDRNIVIDASFYYWGEAVPFSYSVSNILYEWYRCQNIYVTDLVHDNLHDLIIVQALNNRDFIKFVVKKEGPIFINLTPLAASLNEYIGTWAEGFIWNDDIFWAELGL